MLGERFSHVAATDGTSHSLQVLQIPTGVTSSCQVPTDVNFVSS
jgi:hypothetical protein